MRMTTGETPIAILIRRIEAGDEDAVATLALQLGYARSADTIRGWIESLGDRPEQAAFVACLNNQVVAWIEISVQRHLQSEPYALIGGLVVGDGLRGRGIGRLLCKKAEQWAWEQGIQTVRVTSRSTRVDAHRFYRETGYQDAKTSLVFDKTRKE
jgi:GNAT superfamily N-acetyltransferase